MAGTTRATKAKRRDQTTTAIRPKPKRATPTKQGNPGLFTEAVRREIVTTVQAGNYLTTAAASVGIGRSTLFAWMKRGRQERSRLEAEASEGLVPEPRASETPFVEFLDAVERAEAEAERYAVLVLRDLMRPRDEDGNLRDERVRLQASTAFLERKHPEGWSRGERAEVRMVSEVEVKVTTAEQQERTRVILGELVEIGVFEALAASEAEGEGEA